MVFYRLISILFIVSTIFSVSFWTPLSTEQYGQFNDFLMIIHRFQIETILSQDLASMAPKPVKRPQKFKLKNSKGASPFAATRLQKYLKTEAKFNWSGLNLTYKQNTFKAFQ